MRRPKFQLKIENFRIKSFVLILLTIFLLNIVLTFIFYNEFENISIDRVYSYADSNLSQMQQQLEKIAQSVKPVAMQIYYDQYIQKFILNAPMSNIEINLGLNQLGMIQYIANDIRSIYVYNHTSGTFYIGAPSATYLIQREDEFFDQDLVRILYEYDYKLPFIPISREIPIDTSSSLKEKYYGYTFLLYDTFEGKWSNSAVAINVSEEKLLTFVRKIDSTMQSSSLMIDPSGIQMISTDKNPMLTDLSGEEYIRTILKSGNEKGWFISPVDGEPSLVAYSAPDRNGWRYINVVHYDEVVKRIIDLRNKYILISISILLVAILLAFLLSKTLAAPVKRLLSSIRSLESDQRISQQTIRNNAIRDMISDYGSYNAQTVKKLLGKDADFLEAGSAIRLFLIKIDHYGAFCEQFNTEDRFLMKFAILNIASEMLSAGRQVETADMGDDKACLLLFEGADAAPDTTSRYSGLLMEIQASVQKLLQISISITVSTIGPSIQHVTYLYNQAVEGSFQRLFRGSQCIIYMEQINQFRNNDYEYPQNKERQLLEGLMLGNMAEVKKIYLEIVEYLSKFPYATMNMAFSYFIYKLNLSFDTIVRNNFPATPVNLNISVSLNDFENIDDFNNCFIRAFETLADLLAQKKNRKIDTLVSRVSEIIAGNYANLNLSLEYIADSLKLNPNYLGRLFKTNSAHTIPEAIMDYRMNKAKELLTTTDLPIAQIAQNTGFTNDGYFYKAFRKINGVTPSDYRKNFDVRK